MKLSNYLFCVLCLGLYFTMGCTCHRTPEELAYIKQTKDPYESFNRKVFAFNMAFDKYLLKPTAQVYRFGTTQTMRTGVTNFYDNLAETRNILNGALQANGTKTTNATKRFLANTFWGFFGLFDVATDMQVPKYDNDFGQTLAVWGWETSDTYIVLPFFGSSNPRDIAGTVGDISTPPSLLIALTTPWTSYPLSAGNYVQMRERSIEFIDNLHHSSTDFYATVRTMSQQNRQKVIADAIGKSSAETTANYDFDMDFDDFEDFEE